jgi:hypothetical protein
VQGAFRLFQGTAGLGNVPQRPLGKANAIRVLHITTEVESLLRQVMRNRCLPEVDVLPRLKSRDSFEQRLTSQTEYVMGTIAVSLMSGSTIGTRRSVGEGYCYHSPPDKPDVSISRHPALIYRTPREGRGFVTESPLA